MHKFRFLPTLLLLACCTPVYPNWGSTAGGSVATGSFHAFGTAQVEMRREDLHIQLFRDRAKVDIEYLLHNTGPAIDVRAGFPSLGVQLEDVKHHEIENYAITADDRPVQFTIESGDPRQFKHLYNAKFREMGQLDDYPPEKRPELLEWLVSSVHFEAGQSKRVHIRYESLYAYCGGGYSDDGEDCDDRFAYVLSTAAAWKGAIGEGHVTIEAVTVPASRLVISPSGRFRRQGAKFLWDFRALKPSSTDDIIVNLNNHASTIAEYGEATDSTPQRINYYTLESGRYFYLSRDFVARAASTSDEFSAAKVVTEFPNEEWHTPHAPGVGDTLSLEIIRPVHIDQIGLIPGCADNEQERLSHARIREIDLTVNDQHKRRAVLPDEFTFPWPESHKAYEWIDLPPYSGSARKIDIVIRSTFPGSLDQMTCISKIRLRQWLKSRPNVKSGVDGHELP